MDELIRFIGVTICVFIANGTRLVVCDLLSEDGVQRIREARERGDGIGRLLGFRKGDDHG